jgi:ubiquinone/menaquinone biosynthesis C-methylase UbiE/HD superfamily phosphohydrolase YqeK
MLLQALYEQMSIDTVIIDEYANVTEKERLPGHYATHDLSHVKRVINYGEKITRLLWLNDEDKAGVKIAALLHDIGYANGDRDGHHERSYEWAKSYLQDKDLTDEARDKILTAIKEHREGTGNIYGKILFFSDKIDICAERILTEGLKIRGNRQYANIKSVDFDIKDKKLTVIFNTNGKIDMDEMNNYYYTRKVFKSVQDIADYFGLKHKVLFDKLKMANINVVERWDGLYEKEIRDHYGNAQNYIDQKRKLKYNFLELIRKNASFKKPMLEAGSGTGKTSADFASKGYQAYAMDIEEDMLIKAKALSKMIAPENPVKIIHADIHRIPYDNKFFAVTHSSGVLEHFQDDEIVELLNEQLRVSDKVVFAVPSPYFKVKMNGDERFLPKKKWKELISKTRGKIITETGTHYRPLCQRIIEFPKNLHRIIYSKANYVFELEEK